MLLRMISSIWPQAQQQHDAGEQPGPQSQAAKSIVQSAQRLARSTAQSMGPALPWLHGAREVREAIEGILAAHFERQLEDELALCAHCGSARVNYTECDGRTGVTLDGYCETATEAGYSCGDCGAFEEGVIEIDLEVGA